MDVAEEAQERFDFSIWLRSGRFVLRDAPHGDREVKYNHHHDPRTGRFTFRSGGASSGAPAKRPQARRGDGSWTGGGFTGGGGGQFGGAGATGYYMTHDEVQAYQRQHPGRDPYLTQPGDTWANVAAQHGVPEARVRELNGAGAAAQRLKPGQVVALPAGSLKRVKANGYHFDIDPIDRTHEAKGELHLAAGQQRSRTNQRLAGGADRRVSDDGGHFFAARFGGPGDDFNHFAQDANFNRGAYRKIEDGWAKDLRSGKHVSVDIHAYYKASSRRTSLIAFK